MNSEKGQTLPLALIALAVGSLVISPFLGHANSMLTGSRIYGQAITEQYSCDAGIEWALWKLKKNPLLTTSTTYDAAPLEPIPGEINSSSFPITEIRFVIEEGEHSETITLEWVTEPGWNDYPLELPAPATISLTIETEAEWVKIKVLGDKIEQYHLEDPPYEKDLELESGSYIIQVQTPSFTGLVTMVITIRYPVAIYDIRAQKDDCIITARAEASYLRMGVMSWQVE